MPMGRCSFVSSEVVDLGSARLPTRPVDLLLWERVSFFFYIFFRFLKNKCRYIFFLQICHPAAGSFGGKEIPLDKPAVCPA